MLLKLFFVYNPGTDRESEREVENYERVSRPKFFFLRMSKNNAFVFSEVQNLGLLCNVDLFPVPLSELAATDTEQHRPDTSSSNHADYASPAASPYSPEAHHHFSYPPPNVYATQQNSMPMPLPPPLHVPQQVVANYPSAASNNTDVIARVGNHPITEGSKSTNALVGQTFVQPANVDYKGKKSLMFVFAVSGSSCLLCFTSFDRLNI